MKSKRVKQSDGLDLINLYILRQQHYIVRNRYLHNTIGGALIYIFIPGENYMF